MKTMKYWAHNRAFTLIELLVVISIIGVLASVVMASLNSAREKSRDAARKAALKEIANALELYYADHGTYLVDNSGSNGCGCGWFSYQGGNYTKSVANRLVELGYFGSPVIDPSGAVTGNNSGRTGYLIYRSNDGQRYTLWANLESPTASDIATMDSCYLSTYDNYHSSYPADARINYCISN